MNTVTKEHIESIITDEAYYVFPKSTVTVCMLTLKNGYNSFGYSACVDPENFDKELGEKIARQMAFDKIWPLEEYLLKEQMNLVEVGIEEADKREFAELHLDDMCSIPLECITKKEEVSKIMDNYVECYEPKK